MCREGRGAEEYVLPGFLHGQCCIHRPRCGLEVPVKALHVHRLQEDVTVAAGTAQVVVVHLFSDGHDRVVRIQLQQDAVQGVAPVGEEAAVHVDKDDGPARQRSDHRLLCAAPPIGVALSSLSDSCDWTRLRNCPTVNAAAIGQSCSRRGRGGPTTRGQVYTWSGTVLTR